jgi:hypothetical protein
MSKELNHLYKLQQEEQNHLQLLRDTKKQIENDLKTIEAQNNALIEENGNLINNIKNESSLRAKENIKKYELESTLKKKEDTINNISDDINNMKKLKQETIDKNNFLKDINEKLGNHVKILSEQNEILIKEIHDIIEEDNKKLSLLDRKDRINEILSNYRITFEQAMNSLDKS